MYYSSGNYEAFARPRKPSGADEKTAWFVGGGLASMAGAVFLIRDGQMAGSKITILEQGGLAGGALDGIKKPEKGYVIRGGRELEATWSSCRICSGRYPLSKSREQACRTSSTG